MVFASTPCKDPCFNNQEKIIGIQENGNEYHYYMYYPDYLVGV